MRIVKLSMVGLLFTVACFAQDALATVYVYRLGSPEVNVTVPLYLNDSLIGNIVAKSVFQMKCLSGDNQFTTSLENKRPFAIELRPGGTYWLECKLLDQPIFCHVTKEEAMRDLAKINKYVVEQVKEDAIEPEQPDTLTGNSQSVFSTHQKTYLYKRMPDNISTRFTSDGFTAILKYSHYRTDDKTTVSKSYLNDMQFTIESYRRDKKFKSDIFDDEGRKLATIVTSDSEMNSVHLTDGHIYDFAKVDGTHWTYSFQGEVVLRGTFEWLDTKRTVRIEFLKKVQNPIVLLSCLKYGAELIAVRASRAVGAGLFLIR